MSWLFFNMFQTQDEEMWERSTARGKHGSHWDSITHLDHWYEFLETNDKFRSIPWGVGAWGTRFDNLAKPVSSPLDDFDRATFISQVTSAIESGKYPKFKAFIYFDSLASIITPYDVQITQISDIANNNDVKSYETNTHLVPFFLNYLRAGPFTENNGLVERVPI